MNSSRNIKCQDDLINCVVELGDQLTKEWPKLASIVHCPSSECSSCVIQCMSPYGCYGITILGYNCSLLQINITAPNQENATIYAPGSGGDLRLWGNYSDTSYEWGEIYSSPGTRNIILDFNDLGRYNIIHGEYVTDYLNITCIGGCLGSTIICPNDANCNIDCSLGKIFACRKIEVMAIEGTHDMNWRCNDDDEYICVNSALHCNKNFSQASEMQYIRGKWELEDNTNGCVNMPTVAPSPAPTSSELIRFVMYVSN